MKAGKIKIEQSGFILREALVYNNYSLSVQASSGHYCSPRKSAKIIDYYYSVEIAFIYNESGALTPLDNVENIDTFSRYNELKQIDQGDTVLGYVPCDLVTDLQTFLETQ